MNAERNGRRSNVATTGKDPPQCPHCGQAMKKWRIPLGSTWPYDYFFVCFNDDCPYYVRGWRHIWRQQRTRASYRCRLDPDSGGFVALPVWSPDALKDAVIEP